MQVAVYDKGFVTAGKDTWQLVKHRGVDAIINDSVVGATLAIGALLTGLISAAVCYSLFFFGIMQPQSATFAIMLLVLTFLTGLSIFSVLASVLDAGVTTTYVCL